MYATLYINNIDYLYALIFSATFTKTLTNVLATFGSEVHLECAISNPSANCKWYKNGNLLEDALAIKGQHQRSLHFLSISHDDDGEYECECGDESTKAKVEVTGMH